MKEGILSSSFLSFSLLKPSTQAQHSLVTVIQALVWESQLPPMSWCPYKAGPCLWLLELFLGVKSIFYLKQTRQCSAHNSVWYVFLSQHQVHQGWGFCPCTAMSPGPGSWQVPSKHLFYVQIQGPAERFSISISCHIHICTREKGDLKMIYFY